MTTFSTYVHAMGRGPSKGRNLTKDEARDAMRQILDGGVDAHAVGALLMLMRYRGETPEEIAGFVQALRNNQDDWQHMNVAVDWPSYAAGRTRGLPWFLMAAKLVAQRGHSVFLHGWNSHQNSIACVRKGAQALGIATCTDASSAADILTKDKLVYCPLETLNPTALTLLQLRNVLGLRSAVNTALRGYNPTLAPLTLQGVFHPSYRDLQCDAANILQQPHMAVVKGAGGEFEINPSKDIPMFVAQNGTRSQDMIPAYFSVPKRLNAVSNDRADLADVWAGQTENKFAQQIVLATTAAAVMVCESCPSYADAYAIAAGLWDNRNA